MYQFKKTTSSESLCLQQWHEDPAVKKWVMIENWQTYAQTVSKPKNYYLYSVYDLEELIAHISAEIAESVASICLVVKPSRHGEGIGTRTLVEMIQNTNALFGDVDTYIAGIFSENFASIKCFTRAGFIKTGKGTDGEEIYSRSVKEN